MSYFVKKDARNYFFATGGVPFVGSLYLFRISMRIL